jgi:uncharacterized protein YndB with AHSA1/START domain
MAKTETLEFKRTINAPASEVFLALTNATALREWFCDAAQIEPRKGGRVYFAWHQGYYAAGEVTKVVTDKKLALTWTGRGEPDTTQVEIALAAKKNATSVQITHAGVRAGKKWKETAANISRGWVLGLENLQSVLETGRDQRFTLRPMLGVTGLEELSPEVAARLNVPVPHGVRIDGTVAGMGAATAGLQKDDVLTAIGDHKVASWPNMINALQSHRAGDEVTVGYYRGGEKASLTLKLSARPVAEVPPTAVELADAVGKMYATTDDELGGALHDIRDDEAAQSPAPGEWSVNEVLAHLVLGERDGHAWLENLVAGDERAYNLADGNSQLRTQATARVYGTSASLLEELKRNEAETVAMLAALPDDFVNRKRSYWRVANSALQTADHTREHLRQIEAAVAAVRQPH